MATYINLVKLTDQGMRTYKDTVSRAETYWGAIKNAGGRLISQVWTTGEYDAIIVFEAPDDETAAALAFGVSALGNARTTTMRGFTPDDMRKIIAKNK